MDTAAKTILVVEDELPLLEAIKIMLEKNGFKIVTARGVTEALTRLADVQKVDAVWLDHYLLGKESGLDFVVKCKQENALHKNVPIFVVSNASSPDDVLAYLKLG